MKRIVSALALVATLFFLSIVILEKIVAEGQDFLGIVSFNSSLAADEITVVGYDKLGQEQARTTN